MNENSEQDRKSQDADSEVSPIQHFLHDIQRASGKLTARPDGKPATALDCRIYPAVEAPSPQAIAELTKLGDACRLSFLGQGRRNRFEASLSAVLYETGHTTVADLQLTFAELKRGEILDLIIVERKPSGRRMFEQHIDFSGPKSNHPAEQEPISEHQGAENYDMALRGAMSEGKRATSTGSYVVGVDWDEAALNVATNALPNEEGSHVAMVQFGEESPIAVIMEEEEENGLLLAALVALPEELADGNGAFEHITVRDVEARDLPNLTPAQAAVWLAGQQFSSLPFRREGDSYALSIDASERQYLSSHPNLTIALRIAFGQES
ncbi:hypothetical protein LOC68_01670 [Blastopirellula sp. JC732]|uniref:Uncharacterized protein n=1 Tax=Blastopirellula sediminis TaxID=2894196 RepID=A0A9X1SEC4_9BACT|nr:hypothetical protein [Blastopirellula sediminis]MCC9608104.1 hypothetical protein [Blastopirellula sediminis]MCC9627103.1 hypothetical protein [Blastopirellula sediminis]